MSKLLVDAGVKDASSKSYSSSNELIVNISLIVLIRFAI